MSRIADGRVFTGEEALRLKLVDDLGTIDDAVELAGKLAHIKGEPARIWPPRERPGIMDLINGDSAHSALEKILSRRLPEFMYRW